MAKILMKQTRPGSMDGLTINLYKEGQEYEIDDQCINQVLADSFIEARWAVFARTRVVPLAPREIPEVKPAETKKEEEEAKEPKRTRVYELATELDKPWKDVIKIALSLDIDVDKAQSGLTDTQVNKIKEGFAE